MDTLQKLNAIFGRREKQKFLFLFVLMIFAALIETIGIGLIVPFVGIVTDPDSFREYAILATLYDLLGFHSSKAFTVTATFALLAVFILKNLYLVGFYHLQYRIIYNEQVKMSKRLLQAYLAKPYTFHLQRNSAELLRNTNIEVQRVFRQLIKPFFLVLTEALVIICILALLLTLAPIETLISGIVLGGSISLFFKIFRKRISKAAAVEQQSQGEMIKWVNQGLGAGKEVKVLSREQFFVDAYTGASRTFANARRFYELISQVPRMFIETIVIATILIIILVVLFNSSDLSSLLATTSLFAMAAFRLMPSITRLVSAQTTIRNSRPALDVVYHDMIEELEENYDFHNADKIDTSQIKSDKNKLDEKIIELNGRGKTFVQSIELDKISYRYPTGHEDAIRGVSLSIPIGKSVALIGTSGSGKSTLFDIMLGLLEPNEGTVKVDGLDIRNLGDDWKRKIGYIPQTIYLSDDSIRRNVAFGIPDDQINDRDVWRALEQAQLKEFVESLPKQLDTFVGERGVRLSGGQRQRIGIARALYHDPEILFMDEATSALDNETEKEIMKAIDGLRGEKTLIIIAHRLSTVENCDIIYTLEQGRIVNVEKQF